MNGKHEMKELREAVIAGKTLISLVIKLAGDGINLADGFTVVRMLLTDSHFRNIMIEGGKGAEKIALEFKQELEIDGIDGLISELLEMGGSVLTK